MMKRMLWIIVIGSLAALVLVACAQPVAAPQAPAEEAAPAEAEAVTESGTVKLWTQYDLTDPENASSVALNERIENFEAESGIEVQVEQVAWDQLATKLALAAQSGGNVPDIVEVGSQHMPSLLDAGALMPLDDLLADEPWLAELTDGDKVACVIDGVRYCVANNVRGGVTFYKGELFPEGFPEGNEGWLEHGARLREEHDLYLSTFFAGRSYGAIELAWGPLIYSNGGHIFDEEGKPAWAAPEVVEVVEFARALLSNNYIPEVDITGEFADAEAPWENGETASIRGGSWSPLFIPGLQEQVDSGAVEATGGISFNGGPPQVFLVSEALVIPKGAENPGAARAWLRGYMDPEFLSTWAAAQYGVPTIESAYEVEQFQSPFYQKATEILSEQGRYMEQSPYYVESLDALAIAFQEMLLDHDIDAMERLQEVEEEVSNRYW